MTFAFTLAALLLVIVPALAVNQYRLTKRHRHTAAILAAIRRQTRR